jgi:hypothetical protein
MTKLDDVLAVRIVPFSEADVAQAIEPELSETILRIVAQSPTAVSGELIGKRAAERVREYWKIEE